MIERIYCNVVFPIPLRQKYTYYLPDEILSKESNSKNFVGYRVVVDFGRQRNKIGIITEISTKVDKEIEVKPVKSVVENFPFFTYEQISTAENQADKHFVSTGMFLNEFFPVEHKYVFQQAILPDKEIKKFKVEADKECIKLLERPVDHMLFIPRSVKEKFMFYFNAILHVLNSEGQIILMFPTNEYISDFMNFLASNCKDEKFFSTLRRNISLYTGNVELKERYKLWCMFRTGDVKVVVSTKIGAFLPFDKVTHIIVDEPDSLGYKNPEVPMYNAIALLEERLKKYNCKLIYSSFVPSVECMYKLKRKVFIFGTRTTSSNVKIQIVKREVKEIIMRNLYKFKQSIIVFPYKGFSRYKFCLLCKKVFFHTRHKSEVCPYCGGKRFVEYGMGGKKFVKMLSLSFKDATVEYLDADIPKGKVEEIIGKFNNEKIDILITTPVIFNYIYRINLSNVGCIYFSYLDSFLYRPSYLSYETVYKMVKTLETLLSSSTTSAEIFLELTHVDKHNEILNLDFDKFVKKELKIRKELSYPPFSHIIHIGITARRKENLQQIAQKIEQMLKTLDDILVFPGVDVDKQSQTGRGTLRMQFTVKILKNLDKTLEKIVKNLQTTIDIKQQQNIYIDHKPFI